MKKIKGIRLKPPKVPNQINEKLPNVLFAYIFSFLSPKELSVATQVCKFWNQLMEDDYVWQVAFIKNFGSLPIYRVAETWKYEFIKRVKMIRSLEYDRCMADRIGSRMDFITNLELIPTEVDPKSMLVGNQSEGTSSLIDIKTGKFIKQLTFGSNRRTTTCLNLAKDIIMLGYESGEVAFNFYESGNTNLFPLVGSHVSAVTTLTSYSKGTEIILLSGSIDGSVIKWDLTTKTKLCNLNGLKNNIISLLQSGKYTIALDNLNEIYLWHHTEPVQNLLPYHRTTLGTPVLGMMIFDEETLLICTTNQLIKLNIVSLAMVRYEFQFKAVCCNTNSLFPDLLAVGRGDNGVTMFNIVDMEESRTYKPRHSRGTPSITSLNAVLFDAVKVVGFDGSLALMYIWDITSKRLIRKIKLWNFINKRYHPLDIVNYKVTIIKLYSTKVIFAIHGNIFIFHFGNHLTQLSANRSKPLSKAGPKGSTHYDIKESIRDHRKDKHHQDMIYDQVKKLQDLPLSEEEMLEYALFLSSQNSPSVVPNNLNLEQEFEALDLSEEEALKLAILMSQEDVNN
ncbi:hypothetical protein K502DRAFT_365783 [Neoconidiobolus thromboides FSU 785]|nr:hypothetical protein K502DRAFT_365783 [Neoconidiobolus thromboides FSU 785]